MAFCASYNNSGAHKLFIFYRLAEIIYNLASAMENSVFGCRKFTAEKEAVNIKRLAKI